MKNASAAVLAILNTTGQVQILRADLYTFTLRDGTILRFTDADIDLIVDGDTFDRSLLISRTKTKQSVGINVDSVQVTIINDGSYTLNGKSIIHQIRNGVFKGATVKIQKMFLLDWTDTTPGPVDWFEGTFSEPSCDHFSASFKIKSRFAELNKQMPEDIYQTTCGNTLFDDVCGAVESSFTYAACEATSIVNRSKFTLSGTSQSDHYFTFGKIKFTSGANAGQPARTIKSYLSGVVEVFNPFPYDIADGDDVTATAGCDKLYAGGCAKFARQATGFQAEEFIPVPETAVEGGGITATAQTSGSQGSSVIGSSITAARKQGTYQE